MIEIKVVKVSCHGERPESSGEWRIPGGAVCNGNGEGLLAGGGDCSGSIATGALLQGLMIELKTPGMLPESGSD